MSAFQREREREKKRERERERKRDRDRERGKGREGEEEGERETERERIRHCIVMKGVLHLFSELYHTFVTLIKHKIVFPLVHMQHRKNLHNAQ